MFNRGDLVCLVVDASPGIPLGSVGIVTGFYPGHGIHYHGHWIPEADAIGIKFYIMMEMPSDIIAFIQQNYPEIDTGPKECAVSECVKESQIIPLVYSVKELS